MSKSTIKKELQKLSKEQLIEQILELYDSYKQVKEFYEFYANPDEQKMLEKYKAIVVEEFYPKGKYTEPKIRFSVAKKAIADFAALKTTPELMADLLLTLPEMACKFTHDYGDMAEQFYDSVANNFKRALEFLKKNNLLEQFKHKSENCIKYSQYCGYGFTDEMERLFYEFYE